MARETPHQTIPSRAHQLRNLGGTTSQKQINEKAMQTSADVQETMAQFSPGDKITVGVKREGKVKQFEVTLRNRAGKSELLPADSFDALKELGGQYEEVKLSSKERRELGIDDGIQVASIANGGILARAGVRKGYITTQINGKNRHYY